MANSYLDRRENRVKSNHHGRVSEKRTMKKLGARVTPGSGAVAGNKSDGYTTDVRYENKSTIHKSYSLKLDTLDKIRREALDTNLRPVLTLSFVNGSGVSVPNGDFAVVDRQFFSEMLEAWEEKYGG